MTAFSTTNPRKVDLNLRPPRSPSSKVCIGEVSTLHVGPLHGLRRPSSRFTNHRQRHPRRFPPLGIESNIPYHLVSDDPCPPNHRQHETSTPWKPVVVTIGKLEAGVAHNVISEKPLSFMAPSEPSAMASSKPALRRHQSNRKGNRRQALGATAEVEVEADHPIPSPQSCARRPPSRRAIAEEIVGADHVDTDFPPTHAARRIFPTCSRSGRVVSSSSATATRRVCTTRTTISTTPRFRSAPAIGRS